MYNKKSLRLRTGLGITGGIRNILARKSKSYGIRR